MYDKPNTIRGRANAASRGNKPKPVSGGASQDPAAAIQRRNAEAHRANQQRKRAEKTDMSIRYGATTPARRGQTL